ncbi:hypothetical protein FHS14_006032 [Paenibacillus baekrokdamisoli]|nr:hypothetical protein [Paenibacillus baekrokdamisoli]MBB3072996.1 hypothetical protein [Paenibacillus baekrokdamisoli]
MGQVLEQNCRVLYGSAMKGEEKHPDDREAGGKMTGWAYKQQKGPSLAA